MNTRLRNTLATLAVASIAVAAASAAVSTANAATGPICDTMGSTHEGSYVVMNNKWNPDATEQQCITVTKNGFEITKQPNVQPTNHFPNGYPAIYLGCHYTNCSDKSPLPMQLNKIASVDSSITYKFTKGVFNASYDIWLDPTPKVDGVNETEVMIWFNHLGAIQPVGEPTGTAALADHDWEVWTGNNGGNNVISYVADEPIEEMTFDTLAFVRDAITRDETYGADDWYLTSIQAGFEPWEGGVGLAITAFDIQVKGKLP